MIGTLGSVTLGSITLGDGTGGGEIDYLRIEDVALMSEGIEGGGR